MAISIEAFRAVVYDPTKKIDGSLGKRSDFCTADPGTRRNVTRAQPIDSPLLQPKLGGQPFTPTEILEASRTPIRKGRPNGKINSDRLLEYMIG